MTYETRLMALNIAREITPPSDAQALINNAIQIEQHLLGSTEEKPVAHFRPGIDFEGTLTIPKNDESHEWSGAAHDLVKLFNEGSTLICKARNIGMTTLLTDFAASKCRNGNSVLWFSPTHRQAQEAERLMGQVSSKDDRAGVRTVTNLNRFSDSPPARLQRYDYVIVDGLGFLPYAKETEFLATIMPLSERFILSSEPATRQGLFYDLWKNSTSFQKVMLTWHMPLFPNSPDRAKQIDALKANLGDERFRSEFECEFREVKQ